jgi:hypothetical protein
MNRMLSKNLVVFDLTTALIVLLNSQFAARSS